MVEFGVRWLAVIHGIFRGAISALLVPQLLFAHMLADYALQTNWLVSRKGHGWLALGLHGLMVFCMAILVLPQYISVVFVPILIFSILHTAQDWLKIYSGPRVKIPSIYTYSADQLSHYLMIGVMQLTVGPLLVPAPDNATLFVAGVGSATIILTRFYEVSWWSNWLDMLPYMNRWRGWSYAERLAMFALSVAGFFYLAPLCALPRVAQSIREKHPFWEQKRGAPEMLLGVVLAIGAGLIVRRFFLAL